MIAEECASGVRPRRVIAGELMVTPVEKLVLKEDGKAEEELIPGLVRFCRDHPLVRKHPELWKPADPKDRDTNRYLRRLLGITLRQLEGATTRTPAPGRFQLRDGRRERFHLR
jgi:hypothetical protein